MTEGLEKGSSNHGMSIASNVETTPIINVSVSIVVSIIHQSCIPLVGQGSQVNGQIETNSHILFHKYAARTIVCLVLSVILHFSPSSSNVGGRTIKGPISRRSPVKLVNDGPLRMSTIQPICQLM